jgi:hypothetical protein
LKSSTTLSYSITSDRGTSHFLARNCVGSMMTHYRRNKQIFDDWVRLTHPEFHLVCRVVISLSAATQQNRLCKLFSK